ncbi:MAG: transglutaminase family protein [Neomegalonema sp.]|nr:transglutaminase family protein [Neomegalonema sp.]
MSIHVGLTHKTSYKYDRHIGMGPQIVRLRPAPHARTPILSYSMKVSPSDHFINWQQDPFGNWQARLVFPEKTDHFEVTVDLVADMAAINPFDFFLEEDAMHVPFSYEKELRADLAPYLEPIPAGPLLDELATALDKVQRESEELLTVDFLVEANQRVQNLVSYTVRMEPGVQTPEETLTLKSGSCRDSGWLLVAVLRHLGYAARFVSGYLLQLTADEKSIDGGPNGPEEDFTDLHAWAEVYVPGAGWIGLDPTSGLFAGEGHIPLAATPAPQSAAPISGGTEPAEVEFDFDMNIMRVKETPRITLPHSEDEWSAIKAAGDKVDQKLIGNDIRLTMGGEPTFIAATNKDADEWNTAAVGPTKRHYADQLIRRLRDRFAPGGMLHYGQGKWYPGEQLPRWAFSLYWRRDGQPLWGDQALLADESGRGTSGVPEAERFIHGLCDALGIDGENAQPAYEDPAEFLLKERKLAPNLDPQDNKLDDPEERRRLSRVFERGLEKPVSYVLPIQAAHALDTRRGRRFRWRSEPWKTRRGRLFLIPGDSPAGFRLPLRALAYIDPNDPSYPHIFPADMFAARGALPARTPSLQARPIEVSTLTAMQAAKAEFDRQLGLSEGISDEYLDIPWLPTEEGVWGHFTNANPGDIFISGGAIRTAITVEPKAGVVTVFMPPVSTMDEYVDLIQAIEETAAHTGIPVQIEGYTPPFDPRVGEIKVTPDPGVIEVNIHPTATWADQVAVTETLYEEARQVGLEASKFMVDGRPTGSGGGAHVVVGGATPSDSPFLRRPDVLGSLIRYWQNHPSLSYFFSGLFIGPTSQAPRIDEARHDSLYELEIALAQIPEPTKASGLETPPWLIDRILRHLMTDVTGNTHRAEICIDKLFSPDGPAGRLGLVEFRAFEMPPHARMNLAQQLILRALIARFWEQPYTAPFTRFGTALHDRFMLPHYLWRDLQDVLSETSLALGIKLEPSWFRAQHDFRFPRYGSVLQRDIEIELRAGIEPWHVLGEEGTIGGTTRFVDSSVERLQVKVSGEMGDRYTVTCNSLRVPLQRTEQNDVRVAGIRYRTWLPASCLHPTIPPHGPLVFDVVDNWTGRSVGGCTYFTVHPGGRNYEIQPINALEAEGRRLSRFAAMGHTPGPFTIQEPRLSAEFPNTLDMRMQ